MAISEIAISFVFLIVHSMKKMPLKSVFIRVKALFYFQGICITFKTLLKLWISTKFFH